MLAPAPGMLMVLAVLVRCDSNSHGDAGHATLGVVTLVFHLKSV